MNVQVCASVRYEFKKESNEKCDTVIQSFLGFYFFPRTINSSKNQVRYKGVYTHMNIIIINTINQVLNNIQLRGLLSL